MAENKVVLSSDLGLYNGDDCLKFDNETGYTDSITPTIIHYLGKWVLEMEVTNTKDGSVSSFVGAGSNGSSLISFWTAGVFRVRFADSSNADFSFNFEINKTYTIRLEYDGVNIALYVDNVFAESIEVQGKLFNFKHFGSCYSDTSYPFLGYIYSIKLSDDLGVLIDYDISNSFGDTVLKDHSGNGNDGTINGATWWKKGVDQHFTTPLLYRSQLPSTPEMVQKVIDIDTDAPSTGDSYWGLYTEEWLTVTKQSSGGQLGMRNMRLSLGLSL